MLLKYNTNKIDFVDTSEAYSSKLYIGVNRIVIPYVNIGLMSNNPINSKQSVVDFSYYLLSGIYKTNFNVVNDKLGNGMKEDWENLLIEYVTVGGYQNVKMEELEVHCRERFLYLSDNAQVSHPLKPFIPYPTPNFRQNLKAKEVDSFFNTLPKELEEILDGKYCSLSLV